MLEENTTASTKENTIVDQAFQFFNDYSDQLVTAGAEMYCKGKRGHFNIISSDDSIDMEFQTLDKIPEEYRSKYLTNLIDTYNPAAESVLSYTNGWDDCALIISFEVLIRMEILEPTKIH